jgi:hypothetical protein
MKSTTREDYLDRIRRVLRYVQEQLANRFWFQSHARSGRRRHPHPRRSSASITMSSKLPTIGAVRHFFNESEEMELTQE